MTRNEQGIIQLDREAIVRMLQIRRNAEQVKIIPLSIFEGMDEKTVNFAAEQNKLHQMVINVLDEMIESIYSIQAELDKGNYMWPFHNDGKLVAAQSYADKHGLTVKFFDETDPVNNTFNQGVNYE